MRLSAPDQKWFVRYYPDKGPRYCARKFGVHKRTVEQWAQKLGVYYGENAEVRSGKWRPAKEVALDAGVHITQVHREAKAAGVTKYVGRRMIVEGVWAQAFIDSRKQLAENSRQYAHYWTTLKAAKYLGITSEHLTRVLKGSEGYLAEKLHHVHYVRGKRRHFLVNPNDIDTARRAIEADREQAAQMVSAKALCVELDLPDGTIHRWVKELGEPHTALIRGILRSFVTPEVAAAIRKRAQKRETSRD